MPNKAKSKSINIKNKWKQWYIKTIVSYYFFDNQSYKVGNQKDGSIEYIPETRDNR